MATQAFGEERRTLSVGKAFSRGFETIRAYPLQTLGPMFVLTTIPGILLPWSSLFPNMRSGVVYGWGSIAVLGFAGSAIGLSLLWLVAVGAVIQATLAVAEDRKPDLGEMLRVGVVRCLPLLAVYILYWLAIAFGFAFLFVPGVFLAVMWSMAMVAVVAERPGVFGAFGRSARLTKGARWKILGVFLALFVIYMVVFGFAGVTGVASSMSLASLQAGARASFGVGQFIMALVNLVVTTWMTAMFTSLFLELREWKEGPDTSRLSDIFA
ncbi:hypothetical protein [Sphingomonas lycopersici]|uniref:Glycerophosphoryl diester phosphodiesterase membrane domain-containing protein n=1 Tax=Sphingomonas lycopersici TaxID=2951807 RepID=A0AA42CT71_9SPHN|nr:hypothetical protein [Sphingomonas lycopersici]MCW6534108.1 hypothetical protein [Sphingomonas lycopersici]